MRTTTVVATLLLASTPLGHDAEARGRGRGKLTADQKIGHYVYVINTVASSVFKSRADYARWVPDFKAGPSCTEKRIGGVRSPGYMPTLPRDLMKAARSRPGLAKLDKKAKQMALALDALYNLQREASQYYMRRQYKKDGCAKGRALHAKLVNAWAAYADADNFIRTFVNQRNDARATKELAKIKRKYGMRMRYWHQRGIIDAKALLEVLKVEMRKEQPDLAAVKKAQSAYTATLAKIVAITEKNRAQASTFGYRRFSMKSEQYAKAVGELVDRRESGKELSDYQKKRLAEGASYIKGTMPVVFSRYNSMIDESNRIRYPRNVK